MLQDILLPSWLKWIWVSRLNDNGKKIPQTNKSAYRKYLKNQLPEIKNSKNDVWLRTLFIRAFFAKSLKDSVSAGIERTEKNKVVHNIFLFQNEKKFFIQLFLLNCWEWEITSKPPSYSFQCSSKAIKINKTFYQF